MGTFISLTDEELVLLDGNASEKAQVKVDEAKARLGMFESIPEAGKEISGFVADVVSYAKLKGKLEFRTVGLSSCKVCRKSGGYAKYKRDSRHHNKGDSNYDKPLHFGGIDLNSSRVSVRGHATIGCCSECWKSASEFVKEALVGVDAEMPEKVTGEPTKFKRYDKRKCNECGWEGHEGEMGYLPAMMGGEYRGKCPSCEAKNLPLGITRIGYVDGCAVVPVKVASK